MNYVDKYATTSNADLRTEAALNDLQNKIHKSAKVKEPTLPKVISTKKSEEKPNLKKIRSQKQIDSFNKTMEIRKQKVEERKNQKLLEFLSASQ